MGYLQEIKAWENCILALILIMGCIWAFSIYAYLKLVFTIWAYRKNSSTVVNKRDDYYLDVAIGMTMVWGLVLIISMYPITVLAFSASMPPVIIPSALILIVVIYPYVTYLLWKPRTELSKSLGLRKWERLLWLFFTMSIPAPIILIVVLFFYLMLLVFSGPRY